MVNDYFGASDPGRLRKTNQDWFVSDPQLGIWLVADGVGGRKGGAFASRKACEVVLQQFRNGKPIDSAIQYAHRTLKSYQKRPYLNDEMATTLTVVHLHRGFCSVYWVGDSRVYLYSNSSLIPLTKDHSFIQSLIDRGEVSSEHAKYHPRRHVLSQSVGAKDVGCLSIGMTEIAFCKHEKLLLCTDGVSNELSDFDMERVMNELSAPRDAVDRLIQRAKGNGGKDNLTALIIAATRHAKRREGHRIPTIRSSLPIQFSERIRHLFQWF